MQTTSLPGKMSWSSGTVATGDAAVDALALAMALADAELGEADVPAVHAASAMTAAVPNTPFIEDRNTLALLLVLNPQPAPSIGQF
jgi:hypothetical protein